MSNDPTVEPFSIPLPELEESLRLCIELHRANQEVKDE